MKATITTTERKSSEAQTKKRGGEMKYIFVICCNQDEHTVIVSTWTHVAWFAFCPWRECCQGRKLSSRCQNEASHQSRFFAIKICKRLGWEKSDEQQFVMRIMARSRWKIQQSSSLAYLESPISSRASTWLKCCKYLCSIWRSSHDEMSIWNKFTRMFH